MRFLIEASLTPIYNRIVNAFANAIKGSAHEIIIIDPESYDNDNAYIDAIHNENIDYCVIANSSSALSQPSPDKKFLFEQIEPKLVFIHHDNLASNLSGDIIENKLSAFIRTVDRSTHFCLEYNCSVDLKTMGISNSFPIYHASEFSPVKGAPEYQFDVSFLGHVVPGVENLFSNSPFSPLIQSDFWGRIFRLDKNIEPSAVKFANVCCPGDEHSAKWFSTKYAYISGINSKSQYMRGEVIKRLGDYRVDIIGGDPAYLSKSSRDLKIRKDGLYYHAPLGNYAEASNTYATSRINLNITSLQFDNAIINRVIDAGASGGFILTDWKSDLREITTVHDEISYRTIDELNNKVEYYLVNENERCEIARQFQQDISDKCSYHAIWEYILSKLN